MRSVHDRMTNVEGRTTFITRLTTSARNTKIGNKWDYFWQINV